MKQNMVIYSLLDVFFNLSKVKGETAKLHNSLNINQIRINTRNASFSIVKRILGREIAKSEINMLTQKALR